VRRLHLIRVHPDLAGDTEATIAQALGLWHRLDEPELIGPHVINTMQEQALRAFADHGEVKRTLDADSTAAQGTLAEARRAGIDLGAVTAELEREGVQAFCESYRQLLHCVEAKLGALTPTGR
jgi:transaldolase